MNDALLTVPEVADRLRSSQRFVADAIRRGDLAASKIGRRWVIADADVAAFLAAHRNVPAESRPRQRRNRRVA